MGSLTCAAGDSSRAGITHGVIPRLSKQVAAVPCRPTQAGSQPGSTSHSALTCGAGCTRHRSVLLPGELPLTNSAPAFSRKPRGGTGHCGDQLSHGALSCDWQLPLASPVEGAHLRVCVAASGQFGSSQFGASTDNAAGTSLYAVLAHKPGSALRAPAGQRACPRAPPPHHASTLTPGAVGIPLVASDSLQCCSQPSGECDRESPWRLHTFTSLQALLAFTTRVPVPIPTSVARTPTRAVHSSAHSRGGAQESTL